MSINQTDVWALIERAKGSLKKDDPVSEILEKYISEAEKMLPDIKGKLTSAQEEVYKKLEAAVGP